MEISINYRYDNNNKRIGITGSLRDISDYERNKEYLRETHLAAKIAGWDWDLSNNKIWWSDEHYLLLGEDPRSFTPSLKGYIDEDELKKIDKDYESALLTGKLNTRYKIKRKDGKTRMFWAKAFTIKNEDGKPIRMCGTTQDITELHTIETQLLEKETLLKEIHHRVKNNLQVVSSLLSLQAAQLKDSSTASVFHQSQNRITAMALVHEHLYNSKELSSVNINSYFQSLISNLSDSYESKSITINQFFPDIEISLDLATPTGLIINEVISNSFKYAFNEKSINPTISVLLHPIKEGEYVLTLKDNGIGIPDIRRAAKSKSLGMKLIHTLCRQIDASLDIWSEVNKGVKYEITFKK